MTEKNDVLAQIKDEIGEIRGICAEVPGDYGYGKAIMVESMGMLDRNPKKALKVMLRARQAIGAESNLVRRYNALKQKWSAMPGSNIDASDVASEEQLRDLLKAGEFERAEPVLKAMEEATHLEMMEDVDASVSLDLPDAEIVIGRGSTLVANAVNRSAFPLRIVGLVGRSAQAQVIVFEDYKGVIQPHADRTIHINIIPGAEGDVAVELEAVVEVSSKRITIKKHASMRVVPAKANPATPTARSDLQAPVGRTADTAAGPVPAGIPYDPMRLVENGTVDQWVECINMMFENRGTIGLDKLSEALPEFQKMEGYMNLFQALMVTDYGQVAQWGAWFDAKGFSGNELTSRCSRLVFALRTAPGMTLELVLDGSVGSSNNDHLIGALNIASGNILLPREKLKGIKSWDIRVKFRGKDFALHVDRNVTKAVGGARSKAAFSLSMG